MKDFFFFGWGGECSGDKHWTLYEVDIDAKWKLKAFDLKGRLTLSGPSIQYRSVALKGLS